MRTLLYLMAVSLLVLGATCPPALAVTFSDGIFNDTDWTTQVEMRGPDGTFSGSATQIATGGNPDQYRQVAAARDPITPGLDNSTGVWSFFNTAYDPSVSGAIASLDMTLDHIQFGSGSGGGLNIALFQDGIRYVGGGISMPEMAWTSSSFLGLLGSDFFDLDTRLLSPDFSSSGSEILFGWRYVVSSASGDPVSRTVGFDNWNLMINPVAAVPEPATLGLLSFGIASLGLAARRRKIQYANLSFPVQLSDNAPPGRARV